MYPDQQPNLFGQPPQQPPTPPTPPPAVQPTPQQAPPSAPMPYDYLNQIAPAAPTRRTPTGPMKLIVIGLIAVVVVIILAVIVNTIANAGRGPVQQLGARLTATQVVAEGAQPNLRSSQLRSLNGNLRLFFTNTNRDIAAPLESVNVDILSLDESTVARENAIQQSMLLRLEDARLNAVYDRTYAREMAYQLETILALMQQIDTSTNSDELKTFLQSAYENLRPSQEGFANYSETN